MLPVVVFDIMGLFILIKAGNQRREASSLVPQSTGKSNETSSTAGLEVAVLPCDITFKGHDPRYKTSQSLEKV